VTGRIVIEGNRKTKAYIILRELGFREGDTIRTHDPLSSEKEIENRIFNTGIFNSVKVRTESEGIFRNYFITVSERFYTIPIPIFELADRNFNEWWTQRDHDLHRINLGLNLVQKNVRGRNETLRLKLQTGFTKKAELFYTIPYLTSHKKLGLTFSLSYIYSKYLAYSIENHKLQYIHLNKEIIQRIYSGPQFIFRNKHYSYHSLKCYFNHQTIADTVIRLNPDFLSNHRNKRNYLSFSYQFIRDKRDIRFYPIEGNYSEAEVYFQTTGLLSVRGEAAKFFRLGRKLSSAHGIFARVSFPDRQAFFDEKGLGYVNDFVRGYEQYVINGQHYTAIKNSLRYRIFQKENKTGSYSIRRFWTLPLSVYFTSNLDAGFVYSTVNSPVYGFLNNHLLTGGGIGADFVTAYDLVMRIEYSMNHLKEHGFFLHFQAPVGPKKQ
jgi:outer membrane protein assembly factor BamA